MKLYTVKGATISFNIRKNDRSLPDIIDYFEAKFEYALNDHRACIPDTI